MALVCTAAGQTPQARRSEPRTSPPRERAKADGVKAQKIYESALEAEQEEHWAAAFALYSEALNYAPENAEYRARQERARFRVAQGCVDRAEVEAVLGRMEEAREQLRAALAIDPENKVARERLLQLQPRASRETGQRSEYEAEAVRLRPQTGTRSFDFRGNTLGAYEELARQFGLVVTLDQDVATKQIRFRVADVDFETAADLLGQQTGTFIRPIDEKTFLALPDTPEKRRQYAQRILRTVELPASFTPEQLGELRQLARDIAGIPNPQVDTRTRQLVLRGEPRAVQLAMALIRELEQPRGEIVLEVQFLEVDRSRARRLGITPPSSARLITLSEADVREAQQSTEALLRVMQRVFGQVSGFGGLSSQEVAARLASGQVGAASLLPPLIAFGGGKTVFLAALPGAAADFAETMSTVRRARRILLRGTDGQPATFFVGDRFPISIATLTPAITGAQIIPGIQRTDFATGTAPVALATGDFNGDGRTDIATANSGANTISVLLNSGGGGFGAATDISVGNQPRAIVARDFNSDGLLDLAVANAGDNTATILLGDGAGNFSSTATLATGTTPVALASGNFDGDTVPDLAVVNSGDNTISIFLGTGNGNFNFRTSISTGLSPSSVASADFNGDGLPDLAVANEGDDSAVILLGTGNGLFTAGVPLTTGNRPTAIAAGEFNSDNKQDIAVTNHDGNSLSVFLGNGDGTFGTRNDFATGQRPTGLAVADFTGDGRPDLAVANSATDRISLLSGLGDGTFATTDFAANAAAFAVAPGDLNGDGRLDVAAANRDANNITVFLNTTTSIPTTEGTVAPYPAFQYEDLGVKVRATPWVHLNNEVTLKLEFEIRSLATEKFNEIPVISNRTVEQTVRLRENEPTILSGIVQQESALSAAGWPGLSAVPVAGRVASLKEREKRETELIIVVTPRRVRAIARQGRPIYAGRKDEGTPSATPQREPPEEQ